MPTPSGIAKEPTLQSALTELQAILAKLNASIATTGPVTNTELRAAPVPVSGTVAVSNQNALAVTEVLTAAGVNLATAAYSGVISSAADYLLSTVKIGFSTAAPRSITVRAGSRVLWTEAANTDTDLLLDFEGIPFDSTQSVTVDIGQTAAACVISQLVGSIQQGAAALGGSPTLGPGNSRIGSVSIAASDSPAVDAFSRLRVSDPRALFDATNQYRISPEWDSLLAVGGTIAHAPAKAAATLSTTATAGSKVTFQTRRYHRYQPGKSQLVLVSFHCGVQDAAVRRRVGYFDDANGVLFEHIGSSVWLVLRSSVTGSVVDTRIPLGQANLDRLDGTGGALNPSGILLDPMKVQLVVVDLQWLAVGRVRIGFDIDGVIVYAHQFLHANRITNPYMTTANLPVRVEQENLGGGAAATMDAICAAVISEGGREPFGLIRSVSTGTAARVTGSASELPLLSIRPRTLFNGLTNRGLVVPTGFSLLASSDVRWRLLYRAVPSTAVNFADVNTGESIVQRDFAASAMASTGIEVASGYKGTGSGDITLPTDLERTVLALHADGATQDDVLTLAVQSLGGNVNTYASMQWREEF